MKRHCKLIISTITMALIFTLCFSPASYAIGSQRFGAWIASALTALNIVTSSTLGPYADFYDDYLCDPFTINEQMGVMDYIPYTFEDTDDFMDRSVLKIDKDIVTIDGVNYTDVWLSTDAAEKFRTNAFDLVSAFNIASNSNGTFASGAGVANGVPIYSINGNLRSKDYVVPYPHADSGAYVNSTVYKVGDFYFQTRARKYAGEQEILASIQLVNTPSWTNVGYNKTEDYWHLQPEYGVLRWYNRRDIRVGAAASYTAQPFDYDWTSSVVPPDEQLTDEGLRFRVPTSDVQQWYQDYPDTGPNVTINMGDSELTQKVDDLIDLIIPLIPVIDVDFVEYNDPAPQPEPEPIPEPDPYPDPDPQPGTVIPDLDWTDLFQTIKNIYNKIAEHVSISTAIKNLLDKIKWFLDDFFGDLGDLIGNLPDIFERHVIDTIRRGLTGLKNIFLPILALLRNALGIWHYVVEWFQAISAPFTFYLSVLGQGYPLITIPIYASIAGVIVIAVYRRFGR